LPPEGDNDIDELHVYDDDSPIVYHDGATVTGDARRAALERLRDAIDAELGDRPTNDTLRDVAAIVRTAADSVYNAADHVDWHLGVTPDGDDD
jgi:hypothetical protein